MRLSKIKLSGFKSFVDPTSIPLPSNLIGIVGPNGCGKSNTIDAVRWVMGESSAKNLRGESMTDVIFNGSNTRKPVGQASIELVFDNSDGSLGGQYAQYSEISVKRIVTRDGQSQYFQNGARCRRKDITDIFLGTGLGPRSYSIIEQGMISRLIEAKPEDLRVFLEEAAGISKYKERRKETESRIKHTRENMERLLDLRDELGKQLDRLQRQSKTAEKYKILKDEERLLKAQLTALKWRTMDKQIKSKQETINNQENLYESIVAKLRNIETEIEKQRDQHLEASEEFNEIQAQFYSVGSDIARVEQSIQHTKERRQQNEEDLKQAEESWYEASAHLKADRARMEELSAALEENTPALEVSQNQQAESAAHLSAAEEAMQNWQAEWEEFNRLAAEPAQLAEVERTRIAHLDQQVMQSQDRIERLENEREGLSPGTLEQEIANLSVECESHAQQSDEFQSQLDSHKERIAEQRQLNIEYDNELNAKRSELQSMQGRFASLEALQQAALGKQQGAVTAWLENNGLSEAKRLAEFITVDPGWEKAVECVLGQNLEAICVDGLDPVMHALGNFDKGSVSIFDTSAQSIQLTAAAGDRLHDKVKAPWRIDSLLAGVYCANDLHSALAMRSQLSVNESVITPDGIWMGSSWLRVVRDADEKFGVIQREQELQTLSEDIGFVEAHLEELANKLSHGRESLQSLEAQREDLQAQFNQANQAHSRFQSQLSGKQARLEQMRGRTAGIEQEITELREQLTQSEQEAEMARGRLDEAINLMQEHAERREILNAHREDIRASLDQARETARNDRDAAHEISLRIQTLRTELTSTQQSQERMDKQLSQLATRREELQRLIAESEEPLVQLNEELQEYLKKRVDVETQLTAARRSVEDLDHSMRALSNERHGVEQDSEGVRNQLDKLRLAQQELVVRRQTLEEALQESGHQLQALFEELPEEASESEWQEKVETVEKRIGRLGPINLAAIEEYKQQLERKEYLDAQYDDLTEALTTLENAIRKIDKETRARFRETYDRVNTDFQKLFPRLFGGGESYLELTGDDLLDTGVTVMARPPGKRNSSIHLLSGGEKALTAVALVFAIFQLNPAPFCMLDEVDAPLDDANVGRFCDLVREMSEKVQFIFITHNKITMELAHQLNGVTMAEPGVSRLVAVDVAEAVELVAV
ncbi:MAG: chromosome segregation protein SMC [Gammaproteobacteria bacterium]|nr:chromosome segregation protein SMC [Gammaproteobacteria bacterium]